MYRDILIVDDQDDIREILGRMLSTYGYPVTLCASGREALATVENRKFAIILLDSNLPDFDGVDLMQLIRRTQPEADFIMIAAHASLEAAIQALNNGAFAFIEKPVTTETLLQKIRESFQRQDLQKQLFQSEKMASIGQLAAGVAHEINNPIGFIKSNLGTLDEYREDLTKLIEMCRRLLSEPDSADRKQMDEIARFAEEIDIEYILDDFRELVHESIEGADRVTKIISDLKDFVYSDKDEEEYADINRGIESTLSIVYNELKYKADIVKDLGELPRIKCFPQRLNQVFMNILVNAAQAIAEKGQIRIETRAEDNHVLVRISDTGCGIPDAIKGKIFDPFFTTKDIGKGTGIGLNLSYNIIQKHGGTIQVESTPGNGSAFIIRLPIKEAGNVEEPDRALL